MTERSSYPGANQRLREMTNDRDYWRGVAKTLVDEKDRLAEVVEALRGITPESPYDVDGLCEWCSATPPKLEPDSAWAIHLPDCAWAKAKATLDRFGEDAA
jgi:hypothetical protein